jgi:DNA polymerase I-like protein with 3'-5' exonuclease and polymerase domains
VNIFQRIAQRFIIAAKAAPARNGAAFDIETDSLDATIVHCMVIAELDSDRVHEYGPEQIRDGLEHLARFDYLVGHNITIFDLPVLQRLHSWTPAPGCVILDTLIAGRLILPHIADLDDQSAAMGDPPLEKLRGRYKIEAWGARLGIPKVGADLEDFSTFTPEMMARCVADTLICKRTWQFLQPDGYSQYALELEHRVAPLCDEIANAGIYFDTDAAKRLERQWTARHAELEAQLHKEFPGVNLNSRKQIGELLEARGWVPEARTEKTNRPKIDDETLENIAALYPEFAGLSEHYILGRRLGQLVNGDKAWTKYVDADGRIHGGIISIGTPHSRAKHLEPNLAQVPNPKRGKPFATDCRSLFKAREGWVLVACDQATLQDRGFAHYLTEFDGGAYAKDFLAGVDTHWRTATALGLVDHERNKESKPDTVIREGSKSFRYAFLYGAGAPRLGLITANIVRAVHRIKPDSGLPRRFFGGETHPKESAIKRVGKQSLDKFEAATPGLRQLRNKLQNFAQRHGWLPGLDGRRVPVRAQYKALNYIVTSSEAIICKRWLVRTYDELCEKFRYGWEDGDVVLCLWVHDEIVACCKPEIAEQVGAIMVANAKEPAGFYGFKVALDADFKIATNWGGGDSADSRESGDAEIAAAAVSNGNAAADRVEDVEQEAPEPDEEQELGEELDHDESQGDEVGEVTPGLAEAIANAQAFIAAIASGASPLEGEKPRAQHDAPGNGRDAGNGFDRSHGDYRSAGAETHAGTADKPYGPIRARLLSQGYRVAKTFPFVVPGETAPRFYEDRFELKPELTPTEARPRKTSRFWHQLQGRHLNGSGPRRIVFNWPAIMQAAPDATVFITEGANKSAALNHAGLIATAAPYHQWGLECVAALSGRHLIYHEDHDFPDANGVIKAKEFSAAARQKLSPGAASFRIVPALHLWKNLGHAGEPPHGWDVKDWLERGGDPLKLLDICREIPGEARHSPSSICRGGTSSRRRSRNGSSTTGCRGASACCFRAKVAPARVSSSCIYLQRHHLAAIGSVPHSSKVRQFSSMPRTTKKCYSGAPN